MKGIDGELVKNFFARGKIVTVARVDHDSDSFYLFRVTDKCNKRDYYSNDKYTTIEECERAAVKVCKGI